MCCSRQLEMRNKRKLTEMHVQLRAGAILSFSDRVKRLLMLFLLLHSDPIHILSGSRASDADGASSLASVSLGSESASTAAPV